VRRGGAYALASGHHEISRRPQPCMITRWPPLHLAALQITK
jgi:hypothetical protein